MKIGQLISALVIVVAAIAGGVYTGVSGNEPLLGIDLQGGVSVVLEPTDPDEVTDEGLEEAVEIIRSRVDGLGVAEPEIVKQADTISVVLPGAEQQQRAVELIGQTAELRFRPVLQSTEIQASDPSGPAPTIPFSDRPTPAVEVPDPPTEDGEEQDADGSEDSTEPTVDPEDEEATPPVNEEAETGDDAEAEETETGDDAEASAGDENSIQPVVFRQTDDEPTEDGTSETSEQAPDADTVEPDSTEDSTSETSEPAPDSDTVATDPTEEPPASEPSGDAPPVNPDDIADLGLNPAVACAQPILTLPGDDDPDEVVFLPDENGLLVCLGPVYRSSDDGPLLTGNALETARVGQSNVGAWTVNPTFKSGAEGIGLFNGAAATCNGQLPECPTGQLAAVLDQEVISAPSINASSFSRDRVEITGSFDQESAESLALQLRFGALPVELKTGPVDRISASTGDDVLEAGAIAGLIGLGIVALYLLFYYRISGLVAIGGLVLSGLLLWTIVAFIGETQGLALTLSGVVGLVVAIGVSADSNIVYFENVKDSYLSGRRVPTAIERAYQTAISTIVKADTVSLIAAVLLYFLTIGQVKGFALFLGLGTLLDLVISWMFMKPALTLLSRLPAVKKNPGLLGLPSKGKS